MKRIYCILLIFFAAAFAGGCTYTSDEAIAEDVQNGSSYSEWFPDISFADSSVPELPVLFPEGGGDSVFESESAESGLTDDDYAGKDVTIFLQDMVFTSADAPDYDGSPYTDVDGGNPRFDGTEWERMSDGEILLSSLDDLGRTGPAIMRAGVQTLPSTERGSIGDYRPSGWHQNKYPGIVDSDPPYLYQRGHILMRNLCGIDRGKELLFTATQNLNVEGMLPTELEIVRYVEDTGSDVIYRVSPLFEGNNLLASGVFMEAMSEDGGLRICRYAWNVQPGVEINYETGENRAENGG